MLDMTAFLKERPQFGGDGTRFQIEERPVLLRL